MFLNLPSRIIYIKGSGQYGFICRNSSGRSIRFYWPEQFRSIRNYWPEGFRSINSSKFFMIKKYVNLQTFFNPENWLADKNKLFPCLKKPSESTLILKTYKMKIVTGVLKISAFFIPGGKNAHFFTPFRIKCQRSRQKIRLNSWKVSPTNVPLPVLPLFEKDPYCQKYRPNKDLIFVQIQT